MILTYEMRFKLTCPM